MGERGDLQREEAIRQKIIDLVKEDGGISANLQLEGMDLRALGLVNGVGVKIGQGSKCEVTFREAGNFPEGLRPKIEEVVIAELKQKEGLEVEIKFE